MIRYIEVSRKNLVGKTKAQSPARYKRRLGYKPMNFKGVDVDKLFESDILVLSVPVGDYICTIAYKGVLQNLKSVIEDQPKPNVTLQSVIKAVTRSIDNTDILVDCTCPDFIYRYAYWATQYGYKYGKPENRPSKITNPDDKIGAMCKHITALLANKKWLVKIASTVNEYIKVYTDDIREILGLSEDEFIVNPGKIPKGSKFNKNTGKYEIPGNTNSKEFSNKPDSSTNDFKNKDDESEEFGPDDSDNLDLNTDDSDNRN